MGHSFGVNIKRSKNLNNVSASNYAIASTSSKSSYTPLHTPPPNYTSLPPGPKSDSAP
jgi:hypothetical protein